MFTRLTIALSILAMPAVLVAEPTPQQAIMFGTRESIQHVDISPDGMKIVYIGPGPGRTSAAYYIDLSQPNPVQRQVIGSPGNPERLRWCNFVTNSRLICAYRAVTTVDRRLITFSRLMAVDTDGSNARELGRNRSQRFDGEIIDWLLGQDGAVLVSRGVRGGFGVDRLDVNSLRATTVERGNLAAGGYITDARGNVRMMIGVPFRGATSQLSARIDYFYRTASGRTWQRFGTYDTQTREGIVPIAVDADTDSAYALQRLDGRFALYRVRLDGSMSTELVYANDRVDVDGIVRVNRGSRVIGATFAEDRRQVIYFDPQYERLAADLGRVLPDLPMIDFAGASADGRRLLIHAGADNDPGRYYVFDRTSRGLTEIMLVRPQLENVPLANVRSVSYPSADGVDIPAYLTLPPGSSGRDLPAVILPHGGPEARDEWGFDWVAQYLANIGYAVLQPNFRGSAGYGDAWLQQNGFQGWRTSIGDVTAGARWLASEGIADANRMAIVGWSYGGYAALQAGVTEPGLFKAIVAIAPVTDLQQLKDDARGYIDQRNVAEYVGSGPHIAQGSPLQNAAAIGAPVLLFHGDHDLNVAVIHSQRMDRELRRAGRQSELVVIEGLEHDLADSVTRAAMLHRIGQFLAQATGR